MERKVFSCYDVRRKRAGSELDQMSSLYADICAYQELTPVERKNVYTCMVILYKASSEVKKYWEHHPSKMMYKDRFVIRKQPLADKLISRPKEEHDFDDGINYNAPEYCGLYFIGETHFNPITNEKFYWVKIGKASNIRERLRNYNTHCPMLYRIDFKECSNTDVSQLEKTYQMAIKSVALASNNHNKEWFLVDERTYLVMCKKGFAYFD